MTTATTTRRPSYLAFEARVNAGQFIEISQAEAQEIRRDCYMSLDGREYCTALTFDRFLKDSGRKFFIQYTGGDLVRVFAKLPNAIFTDTNARKFEISAE